MGSTEKSGAAHGSTFALGAALAAAFAAGATGDCAGAAQVTAHAMKAKKRLGMNGLKKELDTGHPARWNGYTTVNRAEPKRKQPRGLEFIDIYGYGWVSRTVSPTAILFQELTMDNQSGTVGNSFCGGCGAPLLPGTRFCPSCGKPVEPLGARAVPATPMPPAPQPPQQFPAQAANVAGWSQPGIKCPRCGSTQVFAAKRGWKWTTGLIGSGKIVVTCLQCGNKFTPGQGA